MSNRSLMEFNHDHWGKIERNHQAFANAICDYLMSASPNHAEALERFGVHVFGMRHHSDGFDIKWGGHKANEGKP